MIFQSVNTVVLKDVDPTKLDDYFGLIKAYVYDDGKTLLGIPIKDKVDSSRYRGYVHYKGTTEVLKELVKQGAKVISIQSVLHYYNRMKGENLFGQSIKLFDNIKMKGEREGNLGKRAFGKLLNNSGFGSFGMNWNKYNIFQHDKSNLTIGAFIADYARWNCLTV
jgi:hypothetical protein